MPPSPYFDSASKQIDVSKKGLLDAVATAGTAGKQAFDAAQAQAAQARQDAMGRAAERSALYGVGGDSQTFLGGYDARMNQMGVNRTNFESGLAQTQASGESYLEKARAAIPTLQAVNINKAADVEGKIQNTIAAAKAKAEAEFAKEQRAEQRRLDTEARADARAIAREGRADARAAAKEPKLTKAQLLGAGQTLSDQYAGFVGMVPGSKGTFGADESARALAAYKGIDPTEVNTLLGPRQETAMPAKTAPPTFDKNWLTGTFVNYDGKRITGSRADEVLRAPELNTARDFIGTLTNTRIVNGKIDDPSAGRFNGMTPKDAFWSWVDKDIPGIKTMKTALLGYYTPFIESLGR